jgi:glycosyltransferase involved in cell wall biosynthesis
MTSQSEGIPEVIFESFYHKKPVISTNVGGIAEILEDEVNGLLTAKQNPEMLAEKIIYLFNNKELEEKFVTLSYEKLISNYSASVMAQKTLKEYKNILNGN